MKVMSSCIRFRLFAFNSHVDVFQMSLRLSTCLCSVYSPHGGLITIFINHWVYSKLLMTNKHYNVHITQGDKTI